VIEEALDLAFQIIDNENVDSMPNNHSGDLSVSKKSSQPIYSNIEEDVAAEPHYQVPRSREPYYEVPKSPAKIPLYENVEMVFPNSSDSSRFSMAESNESFGIDDGTEMVFPIDQSKYLIMQPPKEKPPPLPEQMEIPNGQGENFKRINSTKRIKKEIRNKRSSFLGIEGQDFDDYALELSVAPPPDMQALLQEERRLEKQLYQKVGLYENSDNGKN
jgi:F-box protein 20